ncbi:MAG: type II toxin-antitoxin system VapC family toxin [Deltaproteobacteria bacterium]|nr:type II toxin-antitoxin system VapC family toxin [Deltaproteobacteria bacterium]MBW2072863.1 type II toxin-antitoxin system VapC family toxin [Deltaproteobacteria bacterium]
MNLLLDTHTFLWALFAPERLSETAARAIVARKNEVSVSIVTFWEISLKYGLGKLELKGVRPEDLPDYATQMDLELIGISPSEAASFYKLPRLLHREPFDRLIIWQAIQRQMTLVTRDQAFEAYREFGLTTCW